MNFEDPLLLSKLLTASPEGLEALPFGLVRVAADGAVDYANAEQARLSGVPNEQVVGAPFLSGVAARVADPEIAERFREGGELDELVEAPFRGEEAPFDARVRLLGTPTGSHRFLIVERR